MRDFQDMLNLVDLFGNCDTLIEFYLIFFINIDVVCYTSTNINTLIIRVNDISFLSIE